MMGSDPHLSSFAGSMGFRGAEARAADGTRLYVHVGGRLDGRRVVLLHGAPQFSFTWRRVMAEIADRYRVIVPDLRGYGQSELPASGCYDLDTLADDLAAIIDATRREDEPEDEPVLLVAHDWGGPIAFRFAEKRPRAVRHLVAVNAPHPAAYARELTTAAQALRSWYVALFQVPRLERLLDATDAALLLWMMRASSPEGLFGEAEIDLYRRALTRPGRAEAVLAYYRDAFGGNVLAKRREMLGRKTRIEPPVTIVWGNDDKCLAPGHPDAIRPYCRRVETRRLGGVSHWVPEERPSEVAQALVDGDRAA